MPSSTQSWWRAKKNSAHSELFRLIEHLHSEDSARRDEDLLHLALYGDRGAKERLTRGMRARDDRLSFNLVKSICDTAQAEIAGMSPRPKLLTARGNWTHKRRAQAMELMLAGEYDRNAVYELKDDAFLDAAKLGTTAIKVVREGGLPLVELVPPGQILVDPVDGQQRKPRSCIQIAPVQRDVARSVYGDAGGPLDRAIAAAPTLDVRTWFPWLHRDQLVEQILVAEAWALPDPAEWSGARPGRRVVCVEGATLLDTESDGFPFAFWRYDRESTGFWGRGIAKNVRPMQRELNYVLGKIQDCIHRAAGYRILVEGDSRVNAEKITNEPGSILRYYGAIPPQTQTENSVPEQLFRHAEDTIRRAFEQEGVSLMAATSRKPAGLDSGAALREYNDIKSERFVCKTRSFERFIGVDVARLVIAEKRAIALAGDDTPMTVTQRRGRSTATSQIDWRDADLDEDQYAIQVFPSSALPSTPAGRIATVEQWIGSGLISRDQGMQLLDFPDIDAFVSVEMAKYDAVLGAIESMIEDGDYASPLPTMDLQLVIDLVGASHLKFTIDGAPEARTELLLRYMDEARFMLEAAAAQQQQQPQTGAMAPAPVNAEAPATIAA